MRVAEAEAVYRSDLGLDGKLSRACQHPDNLWSLHGLHECLTRRGEKVEAGLIKQRLDLALARSEVPVKASCFCRTKVAATAAVVRQHHSESATPSRGRSVTNIRAGSWVIMNSTRAISATACGVTPQAQKTGTSPA